MYAESTFVPDRLPEEAQLQLAETGEPIGRVMVAHGFALARRALPRLGHPDPPPAVLLGERAKEVIWARAYLLVLNDVPVFAIREWFFGSVLDSLDRTGPA